MITSNAERIVIFAAGAFIGVALGMPLGLAVATPKETSAPSSAYTTPTTVVQTTINEDDPAWDCRTMGNRVCGPLTPTPGCWDEHGKLVGIWPCHVVVDPATGQGDVYAGLAVTR
ncbi:hypothetical protein PHELEMICH_61 [Mycobacterium phage Phelemich]|uniref:Uncharacterized protein n=2 Tax=Acadianvirus reprobate TaxID=1982903 RepID=S5YDR8_9CAUD|nr:hypothetical protein N847_gp61 [Mycobacterium phage Phelemich]YP_008409983.1 hypothetical protein REPROBATE_62 [Mycobacterium phage Reprobate]AGT12798.1 hypothetical protein REPROBATE_62 [Mycobacterium phage Reprobate]AGT13975.1 hypothetical protein PHELEMICH_61 [Mycobacterium phage Phelemich]